MLLFAKRHCQSVVGSVKMLSDRSNLVAKPEEARFINRASKLSDTFFVREILRGRLTIRLPVRRPYR